MKLKKILALILALSMIFSFSACTDEEEQTEANENQIKDANGRIIDLQDDPSLATAASVYAPAAQFFIALKMTDRVKAINVKRLFLKNNDEGLQKAGTVGNGVVDREKLASYAPSVLVHRSNDDKTVQAVTDMGIDVICITVENMDDVKSTLTMLGKYFGTEEAALAACAYIDDNFAQIDAIVETIPESERVTALCMGGELGRIAGNDMLQSWMIEKAGGICVADQGQDHNWITVGEEVVFGYDPEFLFCTASTARDYTTEELLTSFAWSSMTCVKNENIYVVPCQQDPWDMPGMVAVLGTYYMLHTMYPDYFSEEQLQAEADEYYSFMFGRTFTAEELGY